MSDNPLIWSPYCGAAPHPDAWLAQWNLDPILLAATAALLTLGLIRRPATARYQIASVVLMAALFVSPLCALGSALIGFRSAHHLALVLVLAPLVVVAAGEGAARWRLPLMPLTALQAVVFWAWHLPFLYEAALSNSAVFWIMQVSITGSAALWWIALRRAELPAAIAGVLATMVQMGLLGALLVFSGRAFYAPHRFTTAAWALSPLEDQQIAGLLMWVAGGGAYLALAMVLTYRALGPAARLRPA